MLLTFQIDDQRFGIALDDVAEVVRAVALARLPKAPPVVEGIVDFRGCAIVVLDIRSRFGLAARPLRPADHLVVARARERTVGLRVDRDDIRPWNWDAVAGRSGPSSRKPRHVEGRDG